MMIRTIKEIDEDHQRITEYLGEAIEEKARAEEFHNNEIKMIRDQLMELNNEVRFENTSTGQIYQLEHEADEKIGQILRELSQKTGHSYVAPNELTDEHSEASDANKA